MEHISEKEYMELALELADSSNPFPNPKVGALLVNNGEIIGKGFHLEPGAPHAEIEALNDAKRNGNEMEIKDSTLYVTLEPCSHKNKRTPPCTEAILSAGIKKVVFGMNDPNPLVSGKKELEAAGIEVIGPVCEQEASSINKEYLDNINAKSHLTLKMAMSADGKTATRTGDSKWISCEESREYVHKLRSEADAIVVGAGTVRADNPKLTARIEGAKNPYRVIVSNSLSIPENANILKNEDKKTIIFTTENAPKEKIFRLESSACIIPCGEKEVDLQKMLNSLSAMGLKKILIEGGSELAASALNAGIVNKLCLFVAPIIIGGKSAKGVIGGEGAETINQALKLKEPSVKRLGNDLILEYNL